jgi:hypothetical protein
MVDILILLRGSGLSEADDSKGKPGEQQAFHRTTKLAFPRGAA